VRKRVGRCRRTRRQIELEKDVTHVAGDRFLADIELLTNGAVRLSARDKTEDFDFS
jgi:hypothetical protein